VRPRFLADADLKRAIVSGLKRREPDIDFQSAQAAGLEGLADAEVLSIGAKEDRILVSHDFGTMPRHFQNFISNRSSPGVFLISQSLPVAAAVEALLVIWGGSEQAEWQDLLTYLPL
jgi:hypothetical protein